MTSPARQALSLALAASLALPQAVLAAPAVPADDATIVHVLNRLGYGPRPGDVDAVRRLGVPAWIERQLHPGSIPDPAIEQRLTALKTLDLSSSALLQGYELPREAKRELQKKQADQEGSRRDRARAVAELRQKYGQDMKGTPRQVTTELQSAKVLRAVYSERQLDEVLADFWMNHFNIYANKGPDRFLITAYERDVIRPHAWGRFEDLLKATAESPAMLFYLDNWLSASPDAPGLDGLRQRRGQGGMGRRGGQGGFGRTGGFGGERRMPQGQDQQQPRFRRSGLNENYAREIMELHTLGVDGGYTQKDVTEVARCLTGWTILGLRQDEPRFAFVQQLHDPKDKLVLGQTIKAGGKDEGEKVIHLLATHPSTARFISRKLAQRFVADDPPAELVERAAATFLKTGGDIRAVVTTLVTSPEFLAGASRAAKVKTPFEFVVSAVRASGAEVKDARDLARRTGEMGMPLYQQQPPTGYKDTAEAWVSSSGLLARLNFALDLASGRVLGVEVPAQSLKGGAEAMAARLVPAGLSETTRQTIAGEPDAGPARVAGLILGSPEFQRR
jgi:uncharacterized protein (DUF1800 family)